MFPIILIVKTFLLHFTVFKVQHKLFTIKYKNNDNNNHNRKEFNSET